MVNIFLFLIYLFFSYILHLTTVSPPSTVPSLHLTSFPDPLLLPLPSVPLEKRADVPLT